MPNAAHGFPLLGMIANRVRGVIAAEVWRHFSETFNNVVVRNGNFSVVVGDATPIAAGVFDNANLYIGLTVAPDAEMLPRQRLFPAPWAMQAGAAKTAISATTATTANQLLNNTATNLILNRGNNDNAALAISSSAATYGAGMTMANGRVARLLVNTGARRGAAVDLQTGEALEIVDVQGRQTAVLVAFHAANLDESLSPAMTRGRLNSIMIQLNDRLWSNHGRAIFEVVVHERERVHDLDGDRDIDCYVLRQIDRARDDLREP